MMQKIADYDTRELLGKGSQGEVWLAATPARLNLAVPEVAVKIFEHRVNDAQFEVIARELQLEAATRSPYLVGLCDVGLWGDRLYVGKEYLPRRSLADNRGLDAPSVVAAISAVARGAHALHESGMVHRNIKPTNVLLHHNGGAKLADMGLSHLLSPGQTVTGVGPVGAVEYIEPGVVRGEKAMRASDVWSLGACLHFGLTGKTVYGDLPEGSSLAILKHILVAQPMPVEDVAPVYADVLRRCLAPDRNDRYSTALQLADDLERLHAV